MAGGSGPCLSSATPTQPCKLPLHVPSPISPRSLTHPSALPLPKELAHLYHYYLHGEQGNRAGAGGAPCERLPNGEPFPDIVLRYQVRFSGCSLLSGARARAWACRAGAAQHCSTEPVAARGAIVCMVPSPLPTHPLPAAGGRAHGVAAAADGGRGRHGDAAAARAAGGAVLHPDRARQGALRLLWPPAVMAQPRCLHVAPTPAPLPPSSPPAGYRGGGALLLPLPERRRDDAGREPADLVQARHLPLCTRPRHAGPWRLLAAAWACHAAGAARHAGAACHADGRRRRRGRRGRGTTRTTRCRAGWQAAPIFEAFWQGRLIPGARIDTLPFIEAVRQKRSAQAKVRRAAAAAWGLQRGAPGGQVW